MITEFSFEYYEKVTSYVANHRALNSDLNDIFKRLENYGDIILVGGAIRDIAFLNKKPRDYDLIIDTEVSDLEEAFLRFNYRKNRFGGYKILLNDIELDIWSIQNNWAFKNNYYEPTVENIKDSIFFNVDSILINLSNLYFNADYFNTAAEEKLLDIIMEDHIVSVNPSPATNVLRAFVLKNKYNLDFSYKLKNYIREWRDNTNNPIIEIENAYTKHYRKDKVEQNILRQLVTV